MTLPNLIQASALIFTRVEPHIECGSQKGIKIMFLFVSTELKLTEIDVQLSYGQWIHFHRPVNDTQRIVVKLSFK